MNYEHCLQQLHSLQRFGLRPGLQRVRELLRRLGDPQLSGPTRYLHIAGTNGKGSCGAALQAMLRAAGYNTGFFSSPHLLHHCERYRLNGQQMPEPVFAQLFDQVWRQIQAMLDEGWENPTEFEAVTALALLYFQQQQADFAVIECGLGGLHDSTNVVPAEMAIITNVALDHMDYLGDTVEAIARNKAGIIKPGQRVITAAAAPAQAIIAAAAAAQQDELLCYARDFCAAPAVAADVATDDAPGLCFDLSCRDAAGEPLQLDGLQAPLLGDFQRQNLSCAVQAALLLGLDETSIRRGLSQTRWPCRLEVVSRQPLVVIDGGHNEDGLTALARAVAEYWPTRRIVALLAMLDDKQRQPALSHLLPLLSRVVVTRPGLPQRSAGWAQVGDICRSFGLEPLLCESSRQGLQTALDLVNDSAQPEDMLLICGSLYLAADLRACFPFADADSKEGSAWNC